MSIKWVEHRDATGFVSYRSDCERFFCARWSILDVPYWDFWILPKHRVGFYPSKAEGTAALEGFEADGVWPIDLIDARSNLAEIQADNARLTEAFKIRQAEKAREREQQQQEEAAAAEKAAAEREAALALQKRLTEEAAAKLEAQKRAKAEEEAREKEAAASRKVATKKTRKSKPAEEVAQPTLF